jgi:hypothetical protein
MGKVPTIAIIAITAVLMVGISVASYYMLIVPKKAELTKATTDLQTETTEADKATSAKATFDQTNAQWLQAQADLAALSARKSTHISMYMPLLAMTAIWYEYRDDLPKLVQTYLTNQGVTIQNGASMPAPPLAPPTVPSNGFMQEPSGAPLSLTVSGTMDAIEKVYRNLGQLPRVATIGGLNLTGSGDKLTATFPLSLYLMVEGPPEAFAAAAPAAGGMGPGGPGGPGGPPGAPGAGPPAPGAGGAPKGGGKTGKSDKGGGDDSGGGGSPKKGGKSGGESDG